MIKLCDVSAIQGAPPWDAVRTMGIRGAMLRCAIGNETYRDARFADNVARARDAGLVVGPYFFLYPLPHLDPVQQADYHATLAEYAPGRMLGAEVGDLPPAADLEWPPREQREKDGSISFPWRKWGCSADQIRDWGLRYLERQQQLFGCAPLVYSYRYFLTCIESWRSSELAKYPLWLADYFAAGRWPTDEELARLKVPSPWTQITMVQHDGNGGIKLPNGVDADFNAMHGSEEDLLALVGLPRATAAAPEVDVAAAHAGAMRIVLDEQINEYRRARLEKAIDEA
jgi:GH25 family lysozyme M1 (1,4-beta-N-acetylmuramidase)